MRGGLAEDWLGGGRWRLAPVQLGDRLEQLLAVSERNAEFLQLAIGEQTQGFEVNVILGEDRGVTL